MNSREKNNIYNEIDEYLHQPEDTIKWRESYYFSWADLENKVSGFSTIGIVPNENRREFVFLLFHDKKRETYYREPALLKYVEDIDMMLQDKRLSYKLIKPFQTWEISYKCRKFEFIINFNTRFHTYYFGTDSSASWHQHFEASGIVSGEIKYENGEIKTIRGYGHRDKSWGYRDWHQFDRWYHGQFQFKNWSCGFRKDYQGERIDLSGFVTTESGNAPVSKVEIDTTCDIDKNETPLIITYHINDVEGKSFNIKARRIEKHAIFRFVRDVPGGYTEMFDQMVVMKNMDTGEIGSGIAEHLRTRKFN